MPDRHLADAEVISLRLTKGIEILSYNTEGGKDFSGFDDYLEAIYQATNSLVRFGRLLAMRRIRWIDPHPLNNGEAFEYLEAAASAAAQERSPLVTVRTVDEGVAAMKSAEQGGVPFDLVITHWGDGATRTSDGSSCSTAVGLLTAMRTGGLRCPVIVIVSAVDADARKNVILRLGALAYCFSFSALYRTIEEAFSPGDKIA